jgi:uncharacterized integral membrane protein
MAQQDAGPTAPAGNSKRLGGGAIAALSGGAVLVIFIVQNTEKITLHFLVFDFTWPLWLFTIISALFGALLWFGLGVMRRHRRRQARRMERRE